MEWVHNIVALIAGLTTAAAAVLAALFIAVPDGREHTALTVLLVAITLQGALTVVAIACRQDPVTWVVTIYAAIVVRAVGVGWLAVSVWRGAGELKRR